MSETMTAGRELDALVAEKVMGLNVRGQAFAIFVEGEWSVRGDGDADGWMCYAGQEPVFIPEGGPHYKAPPTLAEELELIEYGATKEDCETQHAEKMEEWKRDHERWGCHHYDLDVVPHYSTRIEHAWEVVEKMAGDSFEVSIEVDPHDMGDGERYFASFYYGDPNAPWKAGTKQGRAWAPTAPKATCLAALEAVR